MENYTASFTLLPSKLKNMFCLYTEIKRKEIVNGGTEKFTTVWKGDYHLGIGHVNHVYSDKYYQKQTVDRILKGELSSFRLVRKPKIQDLFYNILRDADCDMSFHDWCDELGYNKDSIKDKKVYDDCCQIRHQLIRSIGQAEINRLSELVRDY